MKKYLVFVLMVVLVFSLVGCNGGTTSNTDNEINEYSLNVTIEGQGEIIKNPDKLYYSKNTTVELTANPASNWEFSHWEGSGYENNTNSTIEVIMDSDYNLQAVFEENIEYGSVTGRILDLETSNPISNLEVVVLKKDYSISENYTTNNDGTFNFNELETGDYFLTYSESKVKLESGKYGFYYSGSTSININQGENDVGDIKITPDFLISNINTYYDYYYGAEGTIKANIAVDYLRIDMKFYKDGTRVSDGMTIFSDVYEGETLEWDLSTLSKKDFDSYTIDVEYSNY